MTSLFRAREAITTWEAPRPEGWTLRALVRGERARRRRSLTVTQGDLRSREARACGSPLDMEISAPCVCVRDTGTAKGRGVFALRAFAAGELVEESPVVLLPMTFQTLPEPLQTLVFNWGFLTGGPDTHALALGHGSLFNHDNPSNLRYEADAEARVLRFIAERRIEPGTELTINYNAHGGASTWHDNKWFERMNVQLVEARGSASGQDIEGDGARRS